MKAVSIEVVLAVFTTFFSARCRRLVCRHPRSVSTRRMSGSVGLGHPQGPWPPLLHPDGVEGAAFGEPCPVGQCREAPQSSAGLLHG